MKITKENVGALLDLSAIKANTQKADIDQMIAAAKEYNCACIFTFSAHLPYAIKQLEDRKDILIGGVVGFPTGSSASEMKQDETRRLVKLGVDEIDMVQNVTWLKDGEYNRVEKDVRGVVECANGLPGKVILECHYLTDEEIVEACEIAIKAGASYIKTGTGWAETGATLENIALITNTVNGRCKVKAAGGVKDKHTVEAMTEMGVSRFGISVQTALSILAECE